MSSLAQIREKVFGKKEALRLVVKAHTDRLDSDDYPVSTRNFINEIFPDFKNDPRVNFLATEIRLNRALMVVEINNSEYNFDTAHQVKIVLPVHVLWQHKRTKGWFLVRWPQEDEPLTARMVELHNVNGWDTRPPFMADYSNNQRPVYYRLRDVDLYLQNQKVTSPPEERA